MTPLVSNCVASSGYVDGSALSELPPAGLLCHPGLRETENHGGELRLQRNPQGDLMADHRSTAGSGSIDS